MTQARVFRIPTRVVFGRGVARRVAEPLREVGASRVLIVTDPGVRAEPGAALSRQRALCYTSPQHERR